MLTIVEVINSDYHLRTLSFTLKVAGTEAYLMREGTFTFFAPTDIAFGKLHEGELDKWLEPENKSYLSDMLMAHIVEGIISPHNLNEIQAVKAINGSGLRIGATNNIFNVNGLNVNPIYQRATNGVIYPVDTLVGVHQDGRQKAISK